MSWHLVRGLSSDERLAFVSPEMTLGHEGALINDSKTNFTRRIEVAGKTYYVKRYFRSGKYLRRILGRSRVSREWRNAGWFERHGIPTPRRVAFGEGRRGTSEYWGLIVCEGVAGTLDLRRIYREQPALLANRSWRLQVIRRLAEVVRDMHSKGFIHNDLQWRNVLAELGETPEVYIIDCPAGRKVVLKGNRRGVARDLAFLDKMGSLALSRTDRMRFFKHYMGVARLNEQQKQFCRRVHAFMNGRQTEL